MKGLFIGLLIASAALAQVDRGSMNGTGAGSGVRSRRRRPAAASRSPGVIDVGSAARRRLRPARVRRRRAMPWRSIAEGVAAVVTGAGRRPLSIAAKGATRAAVSPAGSAAALYFADSGTAQIFTGMPDAPQSLRTVTLDAAPVANGAQR